MLLCMVHIRDDEVHGTVCSVLCCTWCIGDEVHGTECSVLLLYMVHAFGMRFRGVSELIHMVVYGDGLGTNFVGNSFVVGEKGHDSSSVGKFSFSIL